MEAIKQFSDAKLAIVGTVVTLLISVILFTWFRRRSSSREVVIDDLLLTGTQNKAKKQLKVRSKKVRSEKTAQADQPVSSQQVKAMQVVPNGNLNKITTKTNAKNEMHTPAVSSSGSTKTQDFKRNQENTKKQHKTAENMPNSPGEWTVAVSKKKPKTKKESSPAKDVDVLSCVELSTDVGVVPCEQVQLEILGGEDSLTVECIESIMKEETNDDASLKLEHADVKSDHADVKPDHADAELETSKSTLFTQLVEVPALSVAQSHEETTISSKKGQNKSKRRSNNAENKTVVKEVEKALESTPVLDENPTCIPQSELIDERSGDANQITIALPVNTVPEPEVSVKVESLVASVDNTIQSPAVSSSAVFDELGDVMTVASAQAKKKKKPRREN